MSQSIVVVTFPGSNCDRDVINVYRSLPGVAVLNAWHDSLEFGADVKAVILPGGFSYGDYLRCGAMAAHARIMPAVRRFAEAGGPVLGICNGFQILCETGLLPGVLVRNDSLRFVCDDVEVAVEAEDTPFSRGLLNNKLVLPVAHGEGNYFADDALLDRLERERRVVFRYQKQNPNGSRRHIAGICNEKRNVVGLMPHPERASDPLLGRADGLAILKAVL